MYLLIHFVSQVSVKLNSDPELRHPLQLQLQPQSNDCGHSPSNMLADIAVSFSFDALRRLVPEALDSVQVCTIRRFFRKSARFLSLYKLLANSSPMLYEHLADEKSFKLQSRVSQNDLNDLIAKLEASPSLGGRAKVMLKGLKECQKLENQIIRYADV